MMSMESARKRISYCQKEERLAPWEILAQFLQGMLKFLGVADLVKNIKCVAVTLPHLDRDSGRRISRRHLNRWDFHMRNICFWITGKVSITMCYPRKEKHGTAVLPGMHLNRTAYLSVRLTMNGATKPVTGKAGRGCGNNTLLLTDRKEILNSVNSSRKHLEKICSPVFRSQERDFLRTGQNSPSDYSVIRSAKFSMEIIFLQKEPALPAKRERRTRH